jgi:DNA invertase Pin-like site-specific DNA recombinase
MNAILYIRVSGKSQVDGDGPERQKDAIRAFCRERDLLMVSPICEDLGVSGTVDSLARPGLLQALEMAMAHNACIVVERADRIGRDLIVSEIFFRECRERGIRVYEAASGQELVFTDEDPSRKLIRQILGALSEWEKSVIVKKLKAARDRKRAETGRCEGRKPYSGMGVHLICQLHSIGVHPNEIIDELHRQGINSPAGLQHWTPKAVRRVIAKHWSEA